MPSVTRVTFIPVFLVKASATSRNPPPLLTAAPSTRISAAFAMEAKAIVETAARQRQRIVGHKPNSPDQIECIVMSSRSTKSIPQPFDCLGHARRERNKAGRRPSFNRQSGFGRLHPFGNTPIGGIARPHIAMAVPTNIAGLAFLAVAAARTVTDDAKHLAVAIEVKVLA